MSLKVVKTSPADTSKMLLGAKPLEVKLRCPCCMEVLLMRVAADNDYGFVMELRAAQPDLGLEG